MFDFLETVFAIKFTSLYIFHVQLISRGFHSNQPCWISVVTFGQKHIALHENKCPTFLCLR